MLFKSIGELIPLYALYALLFADHGMSAGQISLLFAIWSVTSFLLEVPSGAWADTVSRRALLVLSGVLLTAGFALWTVAPSFAGFVGGFVLWGAAGALASGTFEALLYDDLTARGESADYPRVLGYARAGGEGAAVVAIVAATPLYLWGGYALVGWASVAFAALHAVLALSLPTAPKAVSAVEVDEVADDAAAPALVGGSASDDAAAGAAALASVGGSASDAAAGVPTADPFARYVGMLKAGVGEAVRVRAVRYGVVLEALLFGITAFDEYFALLAEEAGVSTSVVPLLVGLTVLGSLTGSLLAGRTEGMSGRAMGFAVGAAGLLFLGGTVIAGLATGHPAAVYPLTCLGFAAIGVAYGIVYNAAVVAGARLQDTIEGPARATVTSVSGLLGEVVALAVFGLAAVITLWFSMSTLLALLGATLLAIAALTPRWLPR